MAGHGPPPADPQARRRRNAPARGEWQAPPGVGWQHGQVPAYPKGVGAETQRAWRTWFTSWYASHWGPEDLPQLRQLARLYDALSRGEYTRATEVRLWLDDWGISPKGQQDRRWARPKDDDAADTGKPDTGDAPEPTGRYRHLRSVAGGAS